MASFHVMCGYFRANAVLTAEIEQLESYIEGPTEAQLAKSICGHFGQALQGQNK